MAATGATPPRATELLLHQKMAKPQCLQRIKLHDFACIEIVMVAAGWSRFTVNLDPENPPAFVVLFFRDFAPGEPFIEDLTKRLIS